VTCNLITLEFCRRAGGVDYSNRLMPKDRALSGCLRLDSEVASDSRFKSGGEGAV